MIGACVALLAPVGDLFESMIKRDLRIKDSGSIFGPHGGLLDRLDAVLFTIVAGYYLRVAFLYSSARSPRGRSRGQRRSPAGSRGVSTITAAPASAPSRIIFRSAARSI